MKKKKILAIALSAALALGSLTGCGGQKGDGSQASADDNSIEFWTFVEMHGKFYENMAEKWNAEHPDKQINLNVNVMPFDDMHNKLQIALNSGTGTPDFVDIELSKFANFTQGTPALMDLTEAAEPYTSTGNIVQSRLDIYSNNGKLYGIPTHVGATVAFYNTELLEAAGIDYTTIKTWDDFKEAGSKYYKATGKYLGTIDTSALWVPNLIMAELGSDYITQDGKVDVNNKDLQKTMEIIKDLQEANAVETMPGGQPDKEEAYGVINSGEYACVIMPIWYMSRYTNYMPELSGKIAIAPAPVLDENSEVKSVGGGGTGTAVIADKPNADLIAEFVAYAKLSDEGAAEVWNLLGFDPCNKAVWSDETITNNPDNEYIKYFKNNPFDVLKSIENGIAGIKSQSTTIYPSINNTLTTVTLNDIFENDVDIKTALDQAQQDLKNELGQ